MDTIPALRNRIATLEETLRQLRATFAPDPDLSWPAELRLPLRLREVLSLLYRRQIITAEQLLCILPSRPYRRAPMTLTAVHTYMYHLRRHLAPHGITITCVRHGGWFLPAESRAKLAKLLGESHD